MSDYRVGSRFAEDLYAEFKNRAQVEGVSEGELLRRCAGFYLDSAARLTITPVLVAPQPAPAEQPAPKPAHKLTARDLADEEGHVYFAEEVGRPGKIKIGFARDVEKRRRDLQTGNSLRLRVIAYYPATRRHEGELHTRFAAVRGDGEWFEAGAVLEFLKSLGGAK